MKVLISSANQSVQAHLLNALPQFEEKSLISLVSVAESFGVGEADLLLLDSKDLGEGGAELIASLNSQNPKIKIIVVSSQPSHDEGVRFIQAGACGYCNSFTTQETLSRVLEVVLAGDIWVGKTLMLHLIKGSFRDREQNSSREELSCLTAREKEVAYHVAAGESNKRVALNLDITERTVKAHLTTVFSKLKVGDRLQLAIALNRG